MEGSGINYRKKILRDMNDVDDINYEMTFY